MSQDVEDFIAMYGEDHRKLITKALDWLREEAPKWNLEGPVSKHEFIKNLVFEAQEWCERN